MTMTPEREGQVALALLKYFAKEHGIEIQRDFRLRVGKWAKDAGLEFGEVLELAACLAAEILAEVTSVDKPPTSAELQGRYEGH